MKGFVGIFLCIAVVAVVFLFFGGAWLMQNFWGLVAVVAFVLAVLVSWLVRLENEVNALKKKIQELEQK